MLAVKALATEQALATLAPHLAENGYVLSAQNGLNELTIARMVGAHRTMGCFVNFGADWLEPGRILYGGRGEVVVGEISGAPDERTVAMHKLLQLFEPEAVLTDNIWGYLWCKLGFAAMLFATSLTNDSMDNNFADPKRFAVFDELGREVIAVALARGVQPLPLTGFDPAAFMGKGRQSRRHALRSRSLSQRRRNGVKKHSGFWRDLAVRKRKTEIDVMDQPYKRIRRRWAARALLGHLPMCFWRRAKRKSARRLRAPETTKKEGQMTGKTSLAGHFRCAVTLGVDFDGPSHEVGRGIAPQGVHSWGRYSARCGIPRHIEMLRRKEVPCTFFVPGYDAQCHPETVKAISDAGFEVGAHGWLHEAWDMSPEEETPLLLRTDQLLRELTGQPVLGWRSPSGRKTANTMRVLRELGYIYDSSDKDYDLPYRLRFGAGRDDSILELPNNTYSLDDFPFFKFSFTPPSEVLEQWKSEFDAIYDQDRFFVLCVHPRSGWGSGSPARTRLMEQIIMYMKQHDGVRFFSSGQFARWCLDHPEALEEVRIA